MNTNNILLCCAIVYVLYKQYPEKFESIKNLFDGNNANSNDTYLLVGAVICFLYLQNELGLNLI
ncbi:MAG: hypothetical protein BEN19_00040 [Epulopiscium sp. Nuni2H_MBin003]|nr:MAG: hypothetical protein BEN19_00040 [Epulopiscium sp. Nuni2H_MBin003]